MKPVSDRMRPRYLRASREVLSVLQGGTEATSNTAESFSEVKGILNRCIRRDQWDWMALYLLLGRPPVEEIEAMVELIADAPRALRSNEGDLAIATLQQLRQTRLGTLLTVFERELAKEAVTLEATSSSRPRPALRRQVQSDGRVLSSYEKQKLADATEAHKRVLEILRGALVGQGVPVESNKFIDAFARLKTGPAVFEAKSVTPDNELSQVRAAISQLYEYRYRHKLGSASLWIVLSGAPTAQWIISYLEEDRDIRLLWIDDGAIAGPSAVRLFESGSTARKRES